jgi:polyisoprenoid-binding protein YceI
MPPGTGGSRGEEQQMSEASTPGTQARVVDGRHVPPPGHYEVDPAHSSFEFVARHLMARVRGRFARVTGEAEVAEVPEQSSVHIEAETASVDTHDPTRDGHLKTADFFDVENYPTISFQSTEIRAADEGVWKVTGDLTIRDVTRPVTFDLEFLGMGTDPWGNLKAGFSAAAPKVNRLEWGLRWNAALETGGFLLANEVRLEVETELVRK